MAVGPGGVMPTYTAVLFSDIVVAVWHECASNT